MSGRIAFGLRVVVAERLRRQKTKLLQITVDHGSCDTALFESLLVLEEYRIDLRLVLLRIYLLEEPTMSETNVNVWNAPE